VVLFVERVLPSDDPISKVTLCVGTDVDSFRKPVCLLQPVQRGSRHFGQRQNFLLCQHLTKLIMRAAVRRQVVLLADGWRGHQFLL
jgi:hypothetical protein